MDIISFILGYKKGIASAGSGDTTHPVHTVTFMSEDGAEVLFQRSVVDGDNCADVVARGLLAKPTKESTAQYNYTYSGWSLTAGGTASASALSTVTADRTVYAAFASATRYYTVRYYDGSTLLKTESLAYGTMPSYKPEKDGYSFNGWSPALAAVTGDADYYAQFVEEITFAGSSWADIARVCEAGEARNYFSLGDTRQIDVNGELVTFEIAGFSHDTLSDDSGKAGITVIAKELTEKVKSKWHAGTYDIVYPNTTIATYLNTTVLGYLPSELQAVIKEVKKQYDSTSASSTNSVVYTNKKVWAPSVTELYGYTTFMSSYIGKYFFEIGSTYELYEGKAQKNLLRKLVGATENSDYWTRQLQHAGQIAPLKVVHNTAEVTTADARTVEHLVLFGFCI